MKTNLCPVSVSGRLIVSDCGVAVTLNQVGQKSKVKGQGHKGRNCVGVSCGLRVSSWLALVSS